MNRTYFRLHTLAALCFCLFMLLSCDDDDKNVKYMLPPAATIQMTAEQKAMVEKSNDFSFNLFREVYRQHQTESQGQKSMFFSPMGATFMMGMLAEGADGETQREILKTMCLDEATAREVSQMCEVLIDDVPEADRQVTLKIANAIYTNKGYNLKKEFKKCMDEYYDADVRSLDFSKAESLNAINNWAKDKTNGKIQKVIDRLSSEAVAYILNSIYFNAKWTNQFDRKDTKTETFVTESGEARQTEMMNNNAIVACAANDVMSMVCLPYGSGTVWNMYVLLPNEGKTVDDVLGSLNTESWMNVCKGLKNMRLNLKMPKYSTDNIIDMKTALAAIGMTKAFSPNAEFGKITDSKNMYISSMAQRAQINVTEEGTEMVAVSTGDLSSLGGGADIFGNGEFFANRPFVYIVAENNTGAIFFAGVYNGD
ncbi:MAG: serpin family protein [Prevotella sp.]|nr:serpin family protein [Prevotella sp.]